jgi:hypothetical protein
MRSARPIQKNWLGIVESLTDIVEQVGGWVGGFLKFLFSLYWKRGPRARRCASSPLLVFRRFELMVSPTTPCTQPIQLID